MLREGRAHGLDFSRDSEALPVAGLVGLELVDRRLCQRDLLVEAFELGGVLRGALIEQRLLQRLDIVCSLGSAVAAKTGSLWASSASSRVIWAFRLTICCLQLIDVCCDEGRVQRRKLPPLLDNLAVPNVDALDDRWIEGLQHERRIYRDDLSRRAGNDPIHARERQDEGADDQRRDKDKHRGANAERLVRVADRIDLRLELPDRGRAPRYARAPPRKSTTAPLPCERWRFC